MKEMKRKANNCACEIVEPGCNNNSLFEIVKPGCYKLELPYRTKLAGNQVRSRYFTVFLITVFALDTPAFQRVGKFIEAFVFQAKKLKILKQKHTFSAV